jgi:hypothetical protein
MDPVLTLGVYVPLFSDSPRKRHDATDQRAEQIALLDRGKSQSTY